MLVTARDIIVRHGETSAARIREELSGNLCRCTGYVGIVEAIEEVSKGKVARSPQAPVATTDAATVARPVEAPKEPLPRAFASWRCQQRRQPAKVGRRSKYA
jgi:carbon-monoxide dehydrogenase small subunit